MDARMVWTTELNWNDRKDREIWVEGLSTFRTLSSNQHGTIYPNHDEQLPWMSENNVHEGPIQTIDIL